MKFLKNYKECRIVFLDVDGVLNTSNDKENFAINHELMERFVKFVKKAKLDIVLSSAWRLFPCLRYLLLEELRRHGLRRSAVVGRTPQLKSNVRSAEIFHWIDRFEVNNPHVKVNWIVLDELNLKREDNRMKNRYIPSTPATGFTDEVAKRAEAVLSGNEEAGLSCVYNSDQAFGAKLFA